MAIRPSGTPRTMLEQLLRERDHSYAESAKEFERIARELGESATITARHLHRLASGERGGTTPVTRRVLQSMFGQPIDVLLGPWQQQLETAPTVPTDREMLAMAAQRARQFTLAAQSNLTGEGMDQLHDDVAMLTTAYPQRPLTEILGHLVDSQDTLFTLLEGRQPPAYTRRLLLLTSIISGLLAKSSHDLGDSHAALTQTRTAFLCADQADHNGLRAWIRGIQSLIAYWAGRYNESVRYAQQGAEFNAHSTASVWLPVSEARAWAALGNVNQARAAIERAETAWDQVDPDELDELGGICTFSRARQLYYAADALAWLPSEAEAAERYSLQAVQAYADTSAPEWAFGDAAGSACDLAVARVIRGEIDGAAEALQPVLDLPTEQRIHGIVSSVRHVHRSLTNHVPASPVGATLQEQIELFMRTPLTAR
jgi:tetratricopeptide (TPR) repeat protein